ncbi:class I SAM-dependent methyltransferase [Aquirhabdus parva]|uniref:Class I SAM-dependent methyltransferase n=1 Tax=Aquirhabdus parva TaxID=2283318 RepID=A0A345P5W0_9GAMM|nr:class I SAM-dependent methyltransferase [Aquirhabdus parva]AXI02669.1 class I SAM-dependent methyltransferase [Aquirhabdus parva]
MNESASQSEVEAGQAVYSKYTLMAYDAFVLGFSNRYLWRCPTTHIEQLYRKHITSNHLDIGVGTGYFLDHSPFASAPRIALMDLNPQTLAFCSKRIARYSPEIYQRNVLKTIEIDAKPFDSIAINYLLHCLPGNIASKAVVFDYIKPLMKPEGVVFGSTILQGDLPRNWGAKKLMAFYNKKGIFSNQHDQLNDLKQALNDRFTDVSVKVEGCVALFSAKKYQ